MVHKARAKEVQEMKCDRCYNEMIVKKAIRIGKEITLTFICPACGQQKKTVEYLE